MSNPTEIISLSHSKGVLGFGAFFPKECKGFCTFARAPTSLGLALRVSGLKLKGATRRKNYKSCPQFCPTAELQGTHSAASEANLALDSASSHVFLQQDTLCFSVGTAAQHKCFVVGDLVMVCYRLLLHCECKQMWYRGRKRWLGGQNLYGRK